MEKTRVNLTISEQSKNYIEEYKKKNNYRSISEALDSIIKHSMNTDNVDLIADRILRKIEDKYDNLFTRLRLAGNSADINSQVIVEILNSMIINMNIKKSFLTDTVESQVVADSKKQIKNRIAYYKQLKDNKK
jgi:hypothetical protein